MRVAVIGAGPAGMTAAYCLARSGIAVEVFERASAVGGLAKSLDLWGQRVDLGPHRFFSVDRRVNSLWLEVVKDDFVMVDRLTRILYDGKLYRYPLDPRNVLSNLGLWEATRAVASYGKQQLLRQWAPSDPTFEDWVTRRFGRRLYETFFKSYSEKLWGIPCTELDADFASQRIQDLRLSEAIKKAFHIGGGNHRTLTDQFAYPKQGTGSVYEGMAAETERMGGRVNRGARVRQVVLSDRRAVGLVFQDGSQQFFDRIISTMPLTLLIKGLQGVPNAVLRASEQLKFRNTILVYLLVEGRDYFPDQWLYVQSPDFDVGRITNFRNWASALCRESGHTILALEYWAFDDQPSWLASDDALVARGTREIRRTGLVGEARILAGHVVRLRRCYPVYRRGYRQHLNAIREYLEPIANLSAIGRYGAFKYNNQDHSILMGILAAENVSNAANHDLWGVNTADDYREAATIPEIYRLRSP